MNFAMSEEVRAIIEKDLPREAGDLLRQRLEQADKLEKENESLRGERDSARGERDRHCDVRNKIIAREENAAANEATNKVDAAINEKRSRELELAEVVNSAQAESLKCQMAHSDRVLDLIFGNRIIRTNIQAEVPFRRPDRDEVGYDNAGTTHTAVGEGDKMRVADTTTTTEER